MFKMTTFIGAAIFLAVFARFFRWVIRKLGRKPAAVLTPHILSFSVGTVLYSLLGADGPFAHGWTEVFHTAALYLPAQSVSAMYDVIQARRKRLAKPAVAPAVE